MSVVQATNAIDIFSIPSFWSVRQHSDFDHSWGLTLQLHYFVGNIVSNQARDPNEKLSMEMYSRAQ